MGSTSILENDSKTVLGVELMIGAYAPDWNSEVLRSVAQDPSRQMQIPEAMVLQEVEDLANGNINRCVLRCLEPYREKARQMFGDPVQHAAYERDVQSIKFVSKTRFGPLTYIRYVKERRDKKNIIWSAMVRRVENSYFCKSLR